MERLLYGELQIWKEQVNRLPLIVRGARQVGKSFLVEELGRREFGDFQTINFEKRPQLSSCFQSLDPKEILRELELQTGYKLIPGRSLLFLDEIQDCPQALRALRYFAEEMPDLHVIAAGSLLEFILEDKQFSFPVGRVQIMNLGPLSFMEYLGALQQTALVELLKNVKSGSEISKGVHEKLLGFVRDFLYVGGMPGVVSAFTSSGSYLEAQRRQSAILDLYALDFGKYATKYAEYRHLKTLFERAPNLVGKHFKFSKIDPNCANPARDYREALNRLKQARLIFPIHLTKGNGLPLRAERSEKKFKIFLLDVGLFNSSIGLNKPGMEVDLQSSLFRGVVAEQFVAQELRALQDPFIEKEIYYWENTERSSSAEIDFLVDLLGKRIPIEVKAGSTGRLKSLRQFMEKKRIKLGVRISEYPLEMNQEILSVPYYLISEVGRFMRSYTEAS